MAPEVNRNKGVAETAPLSVQYGPIQFKSPFGLAYEIGKDL